MTATAEPQARGGPRLLGFGALACLACCAGPVVAFVGGASVAGLPSAPVLGGAGLLVAAAAACAALLARRRRAAAGDVTVAVSVAAPTRRDVADTEEVPVE